MFDYKWLLCCYEPTESQFSVFKREKHVWSLYSFLVCRKKIGQEDKLPKLLKYLRVRAQIIFMLRILVLIRFHLNLSSKSDFLSTLQNPLKMREQRSQRGTEQCGEKGLMQEWLKNVHRLCLYTCCRKDVYNMQMYGFTYMQHSSQLRSVLDYTWLAL